MSELGSVANESTEQGASAKQLGGRWSILFIAGVFGAVAGISILMFLVNLAFDYPGTDRRVIVIDPLWMVGHLVRGFGLGAIAYRLWCYQKALKHWRSSQDADAEKFAQAHFAAWVTGALVLGALLIFAVSYVSFGGPRYPQARFAPRD